jgi:uncharacterized protein YjiS (DUF1127 family)
MPARSLTISPNGLESALRILRGIWQLVEPVLSHGHALVERWAMRARTRQQLELLDERLLHDIGLSRHDVTLELRKRFWQR